MCPQRSGVFHILLQWSGYTFIGMECVHISLQWNIFIYTVMEVFILLIILLLYIIQSFYHFLLQFLLGLSHEIIT